MIKNNLFKNNLPFFYIIIPFLKFTKKLEKEFNNSFFKTNNKNPYRQFYHNIPIQDKNKFINYLYPNIDSCKNSHYKCKPYADIRIYNI